MTNKPACVLFSGGADSTLAAYLVAQDHLPVHLLSFKHCWMSELEKTTRAAQRFKEHVGKNVISHHWCDITPLWRKISSEPVYASLRRCGLYTMVLKSCVACKVAMHLLTAAYCIEHKIGFVADGAHPKGAELFPEQLDKPIEVLRTFYQQYGIRYENPVYRVDRSDFELFRLGVTEKRNTKDEHLYYSNQFACHVGLIAYLYFYMIRPFTWKRNRTLEMAITFLKKSLLDQPIFDPLNEKGGDDG